jgi:hypothetical protein
MFTECEKHRSLRSITKYIMGSECISYVLGRELEVVDAQTYKSMELCMDLQQDIASVMALGGKHGRQHIEEIGLDKAAHRISLPITTVDSGLHG